MDLPIKKLSNCGALITTVPTIEQIKAKAAEIKAQQRKEELEKESGDEIKKEISKSMPMSETIVTLLDYIAELYPDSSFLVLGIKPGEYIHSIKIEHKGDLNKLAGALCECMKRNSDYMFMVENTMRLLCRECTESEAETAISGFQNIIEDLKKGKDPLRRITLIEAEIKRLRRSGRMDLVKIKQDEIDEIRREINSRKEAEKHKAEIHEKRLAALALANEALAKKREKKRQAKNNFQPNFAKMSKQKRQQLAARKAEKKKRKAGASNDNNITSCSQLLK